jgi:class 3 adenylate cyclase
VGASWRSPRPPPRSTGRCGSWHGVRAEGSTSGFAAGDVVVAEDDRFGLTVVEAARLCAAAGPGVGLATRAAVEVAGGDVEASPSDQLELKGLGSVEAVPIGPMLVRRPTAPTTVRPRLGAILVTDLVNSTRLVAPLSREGAEALRRSHFGILRGVSDRHRGREIANLGDGLVLEFASVTSAVEAAMAMHRGLTRHNRRADVELVVRTSVAAGELSGLDQWDEPPLARSLALQELAGAGEIVLDELALRLTSDRAREAVESRPEHPEARLVRWKHTHLVPLPTQMAAPQRVGFAGRETEMEVFAKAWGAVVAGTSKAVVVSGEAGIGKSRLSKEVALGVFEAGGVVLHGRCGEELAIPYQPFVQALEHLIAHLPEPVLAQYVEQYGGALAQIVPELHRRIVIAAENPSPGVDGRLALFEAIAGLLKVVAGLEPSVLVLEDLHWADPGTTLLLKHLVRSINDTPLMIVGNFRPVALDEHHPLAATLADLRGEQNIERIVLTGLDEAGVVGMVTEAAGHELDHDAIALAGRIQHECGGNPFMVNEILLHLVETQGVVHTDGGWKLATGSEPLRIPASVREVISQRIARLGEITQSVLRTAAVIGMVFDFDVLLAISRHDEDDVLDALDDAVAAALLWDPSDFDGRFSFGHAVFQKTLYEELGPTRRARTHRQIAEHLESSAQVRPAELARHWSAAGAVGDRVKVCEYAQLAGEAALGELAYEAAASHFRTALETVDLGDESTRIDLLLHLGGAQRAGGMAAFTSTFQQAAALAHDRGDAERVARAALGASLAGTWRGAAGTVWTTWSRCSTGRCATSAGRIRSCGPGCWRSWRPTPTGRAGAATHGSCWTRHSPWRGRRASPRRWRRCSAPGCAA